MHIRTITVGARETQIMQAARAAEQARKRLSDAGYQIQTVRLAMSSVGANRCADLGSVFQGAERLALDYGFDYISLGGIDLERMPSLAEALADTAHVFAATHMTTSEGSIDPAALAAAAATMVELGRRTPDGFGNLRFAALAGVPHGSPFFPAAYHDGGEPWVAIGPEAAALAVDAVRLIAEDAERRNVAADTPDRRPDINVVRAAQARLTGLIEQHDQQMNTALDGLERTVGVRFAGCDWSLAPHPDLDRSVGAAIEALSGVPFGAWGTLGGVRRLTAAIQRARVVRLGFSGVMLPVLEDAVLAQRNTEGRYTLRDLLAFSAVCGTGLDTIPLPGDTTTAQITDVLTEVAALSATLRKPLTARLLPVPGLQVGEQTRFGFAYFVNTRTMAIEPD